MPPPVTPLSTQGGQSSRSFASLNDPVLARPEAHLPNSKLSRLVRRLLLIKPEISAYYSNSVSDVQKTYLNRLKVSPPRPSASASASASHLDTVTKPVKIGGPVIAEHPTFVPSQTLGTEPNNHDAEGYGYPLANPTLGILPQNTTGRVSPTLGSSSTRPASVAITFSPLPPLPSRTVSANVTSRASTSSSVPTSSPSLRVQVQTNPPKLDLAVIVLLVAGAVLLLLGGGIVIRICVRKKRRLRPTPSLPILQDGDTLDGHGDKTEDSPLFGGKERFSPLPGTAGQNWTWVQYTRPNQVASQPIFLDNSQPNGTSRTADDRSTDVATVETSDTRPLPQPVYNARRSFLQQLPPAHSFSRTGNRLSHPTPSMYSPATNFANIGVAISGLPEEGGFAEDPSKGSYSKDRRRSQHGVRDARRESGQSFAGLPYDDKDDASSTSSDERLQEAVINSGHVVTENRARINSGYFATGTYPRISTMASVPYSIGTATRVRVGQRNSMGKGPPIPRSNSKRLRETQALTYALGLATPRTENVAPSPQETLYPDDSLSVAESRQFKPSLPTPRYETSSRDNPGIKESRTVPALGNGTGQVSLASRMHREGNDDSNAQQSDFKSMESTASEVRIIPTRKTDKPPRVPSPPPLPSLTQMGLAHSNPEGYANYRSPTYSIYGLYEAGDRKSMIPR